SVVLFSYAYSSWIDTSTVSPRGPRQRPHSPSTGAVTVPETSTPSDTDSIRRSSKSVAPAGTPIRARPRSSGAGTDRLTLRIAPGRRGRSRVSRTSGDRGFRWIGGGFCIVGSRLTHGQGVDRRASLPDAA